MKSNFVHPHSHLVPLKEIPRAQRVLLYSRYGTPHRDNAEVYKTRPETGSPVELCITADRHRHLPTRAKVHSGTHRK